MEHAAPFEAVRPWRTAAIVASGIAALELFVLIAAGAILLGRPLTAHGAKPSSRAVPAKPAKPVPKRAPLLPRARTPVLILNGNGRNGAAHAEATVVQDRGYPVSGVGNATSAANGPTLVMYRPGFEAEAQRLARDLGIRVVGPLDGLRQRSLDGARLVVVLGL